MDLLKHKANSAQHAFFYLTSFFALAFVAFAVGGLFFQVINYYFPEVINGNDFSQGSVKFSIAALIVAAPVFYFLSRIINRSIAKKNLDQDSGVRRWLTYLIMFVTIATVMGDLITTIFSFLDGELTIRFFLKALTILVVAGGIFTYYLMDMKNASEKSRKKKNKLWGIAYWIVVLIPFIWSLTIMENPAETKLRKIDRDTEQMLSTINDQIESYHRIEQKIPNELSELTSPQYYMPSIEKIKEKGITYKKIDERKYELCANFERDNTHDDDIPQYSPYDKNWTHTEGVYCFTLKVSKPTEVVPVDMVPLEGL